GQPAHRGRSVGQAQAGRRHRARGLALRRRVLEPPTSSLSRRLRHRGAQTSAAGTTLPVAIRLSIVAESTPTAASDVLPNDARVEPASMSPPGPPAPRVEWM